jgi:PAS domain S-box-containing protein
VKTLPPPAPPAASTRSLPASTTDTASPVSDYRDIASLAASLCDAPMALIMMRTGDDYTVVATHGLSVTPELRAAGFCARTLAGSAPVFSLADATADPHFRDAVCVRSEPGIRFYAGAKLTRAPGDVLGTICVLDHRIRPLSPAQENALATLSRQVVNRAELTRMLALRESETDRLRLALDRSATLEGIINQSGFIALRRRLSPGWPIDFVSENVAEFGLSPTDLIGRTSEQLDFLHPDDRPRIAAERHRFLASTATALTQRYRLVVPGQPLRWIDDVTRIVHPACGGEPRLQSVLHDVTAAVARKQHLHLMDQALRACNNGIVIVDAQDPDRPVIQVNPAFERMTGYSAAEVIGRNCRFLQGDDRDQPSLHELRAALAHDAPCRVILRNYRKDGTLFWNELDISPVRSAQGLLTHFIGVQTDVTARIQTEESLQSRDAIHQAASYAAELLLNATDYAASLPFALEQIGEATHADHVAVWRQHNAFAGSPRLSLETLWGSDLPPSARDSLRDLLFENSAGWSSASALREGRPVQNRRESCAPAESAVWLALGANSFVALPIFAGPGRFWGMMSLGFKNDSPPWSAHKIDALLSTTRVLGAILLNRSTARAHLDSESRYRSLVSNLKEAVFQTDDAGFWTFLNPAWEEITGYSVAESLDTLFLNYVHPDDRERNNQLFLPLIERKKDYCRHEVRYLTKDGGYRWVEVFARLVLDEDDRIRGTAGTLQDITERKFAEEDLGKQRAAIEAAIDGVAILDASGCFTYLNTIHLELFGYAKPADLIGQSWRTLYSDDEVRRLEDAAFPALIQDGRWRGIATARRRDGTTFAEELSLTQIRDGGLVCVCRDITDRLRAEEIIRVSLAEKEVLLKEIHHRVKNNMQIISSLLNLQLGHLHDETSRRLFAESQGRIASMALIHEKLYQSSDLGHIDFADYLRDLTENLVSAVGASSRGIAFDLQAASIELGIDTAIPCGLIVNEIVSNACKHAFAPGTAGRIEISLSRIGAGEFRLCIRDNGRGIPADFDLRQTKSLGMQLVKTLVRQLRGDLQIERSPGAAFIITFREIPRKNPA